MKKSCNINSQHGIQKQNGFTLIEVIVYIGLFGLLMSGVIVATYQLLDGGSKNQIATSVQEEGLFMYRKINWALSGAAKVTSNASNTLSIVRNDLGSDSPLVFTAINNNQMTLKRGTGLPFVLNSDTFDVTEVGFTVSPGSGGPTSITVAFKVRGKPFLFNTYLHN